MVTRQRQLPAEHGFDGPELGVSSVVAGRGRLAVTDLNFVNDADDVFAGVPLRVAHHHQQGRLGSDQARLFLKFPYGCMNGVLTLVDKTTGQRPGTFHRGVFSLDEQDGVAPSDGGVSRKSGVQPAVAFVARHHVTHRSGDRVPDRSEWP